MAEELVMDAPATKTVFDGFSDVVIKDVKEPETAVVEPPKEPVKAEEKIINTPIEDGRNYLKEKLGYEDWDSAKNEIETLRNKAQTPAEIKYANEQSKKLAEAWQAGKMDEVFNYLSEDRELQKMTSAEVNKGTAADIIKLGMRLRYKDEGLTDQEINYKYNKMYSIPKEPSIKSDETEEEFEDRKKEWKEIVEDVETNKIIDAKVARKELEKFKTELKFPEIAQVETTTYKPPTSEEQAMALEAAKRFVQTAQEEINKFEGFTVDYKNKDVDIKSTYALSPEEKSNVISKMQLLADKDYNSNAIFAERWVNDDNTFNFNQMAKDIAILETYDKAGQKFVADSANKAIKQFIKDKHNVDLGNDAGNGQLQLEDKEQAKKNEDAIWGLN